MMIVQNAFRPAVFFVLFMCSLSFSQSGWNWQNPLPQGNDLNDIAFVGTNKGWNIGDHGTILYSDNGGLNWSKQQSTTSRDLYACSFINDAAGWAVGTYGTLVHWNGSNWAPQESHTSAHLYDIHFINLQTGWAVGQDQTVLFTDDGGNTWAQRGYTGTNHYFSACFLNENNGYVAGATGSYGIINYTSDGGATWKRELIPTKRLNAIDFADENSGWAVGDNGIIFHKADADSGWKVQSSGTTANLTSVYAHSSTKARVTAVEGLILYTDDGGNNWYPQTSPVSDNLHGICMLDASTGWITGKAGTLVKTYNGGETWERLSSGPTQNLRDIDFDQLNRGIVVGNGGLIYLSPDGGNTWDEDSSGISVNLFACDLAYSPYWGDHGTAIGYGGTILKKAMEPGEPHAVWVPKEWGSHEDLYDIHIFFKTAWVTGQFGTILKTTNRGYAWESQHQDMGYHLYSIYFSSLNRGWAVGMSGTILTTEDGGETWTEQTSPVNTILKSVHFNEYKTGWAVGTSGAIIYTTDGGENWLEKTNISNEPLNAVYFTDKNNGWIVGFRGTILRTSDGGETWAHQWSGTDNDLNSVYFLDAARGWICGENGTILYTEDAGGSVYYQIYPRPNLNRDIIDFQTMEDVLVIGSKKPAQDNDLLAVEVMIDSLIHPSIGELEFTLSHAGVTDTLIFQTGAGKANCIGLKLSDAATMPVDSGFTPFTGSYKPFKPLSAFAGLDPAGEWKLKIYDSAEGNTGKLHSWSLKLFTENMTTIRPKYSSELPTGFELYQNYPNPFNPSTVISYKLPVTIDINLSIYNILGQKIVTLVNGRQSAGKHKVEWDANGFASGVYLYILSTDKGKVATKKLLLLK